MSFTYAKDTLPNGLTVVTLATPHLHTATVVAYVRTGSRHEDPRTNGVSHFLEHMFFRGSEGFPDTVRMNATVEGVGGNLNGVTGRDYGAYYTPLHPKHLDVGFAVIGDLLSRPLLRELEVERHIILEEMLDEVDERGRDIDLDNLAKRQLFDRHPLALKIAGTPGTVSRLSLDTLREHWKRHYVAGNMVVVAAGDVERRRTVGLARAHFGRLPPGERNRETAPSIPTRGPAFHFVEHREAQTSFRLSFPIVPEHHRDAPALTLLRRVLDDGLSSRLPFRVVEERGLAYSVYASIDSFDDVAIFELGASCAPENAAEVFNEMVALLVELRRSGPSEDELKRGHRRLAMSLDFVQDSPGDLAGYFGATELFRTPEPFARRVRRSRAVTVASARDAARRYFTRERLHVVGVGPRKGRTQLARAVNAARLG